MAGVDIVVGIAFHHAAAAVAQNYARFVIWVNVAIAIQLFSAAPRCRGLAFKTSAGVFSDQEEESGKVETKATVVEKLGEMKQIGQLRVVLSSSYALSSRSMSAKSRRKPEMPRSSVFASLKRKKMEPEQRVLGKPGLISSHF